MSAAVAELSLIDPFRLCLALGPVAIYLLLLGAINFSRRPFLVSGTRDAAVLGLAVSGLMIVGPLELFVPIHAVLRFGPYVWGFLILLYAMGLTLLLLFSRPRLVVYNVTTNELRPILAEVVARLDQEARWAGDSLLLPNLGAQLHLDSLRAMRNVSLVATGPRQSHLGWRQLEVALRAALGQCEVPRNPRSISLISAGLLLLVFLLLTIAQDPQAVAEAMFDMIRL